ncbi:hypothetical protein BaRGS_00004866 [Batillaria attramentaria]|uniref:Ig-like domain-containing protein n=1 Tax=Batillaria attramentaria TaxID=370345 RepID=A0ABD0LXA8_9CAEN
MAASLRCLLACLLYGVFVNADLSIDCGVRNEAREGSDHVITCDGLDENSTVIWRFVRGNSPPLPVGECNGENSCTLHDSSLYQMTRAGDSSTVRVKEVTRVGETVLGQWRCQQTGQQASCSVYQIIYPAVVNRDRCSIVFNESSKLVNARCSIIKAFPMAQCSWFYYREGHTIKDVPGSDTETTFTSYGQPDRIYYRGECRIHEMPIPKDEGDYVFRVRIMPGGVEPDVDFAGTNRVAHPGQPRLTDCIKTYIDYDKQKQSAPNTVICACSASELGSPPGHLVLSHPNGTDVKASPSAAIPLHLKDLNREDSGRPFPCSVRHHTGNRDVNYTPLLAYGPDHVFITPFNTQETSVTLQCFSAGTNPMPEITWHFESIDVSRIGPSDKGRQVNCTAKNPKRINSLKSAQPYYIGGQGPRPVERTADLQLNMAVIRCLLAFLLFSQLVEAEWEVDCGIRNEASEGREHIITCSGLDENSTVEWRHVFTGTNPTTIGHCTAGNTCTNNASSLYEITRNGASSTVRVKNVTREGETVRGEWRCQQSGQQVTCWVHQIIYPAEVNRDRCSIVFNESSKLVNARCSIVKAFPMAQCLWRYHREKGSDSMKQGRRLYPARRPRGLSGTVASLDRVAVKGHTIKDVPGSDTQTTFTMYGQPGRIYYRGEIHEMPIPKEEGDYVFRVRITPGEVEPTVDFTGTNRVAHPSEPHLIDCITDYVDFDKYGQSTPNGVICKCSVPELGSPPGHLVLRHPSGSDVTSSPSAPILLHFEDLNREDSGRPFRCSVQHHTGNRAVNYTPLLAYGPDHAFITPSSADEKSVTLKCFSAGTNPMPDITWHYDNIDVSRVDIGDTYKDGSYYIRTLTITIGPSDKGRQVNCTAENPKRSNSLKSAQPYYIGGQGPMPGTDGSIVVFV